MKWPTIRKVLVAAVLVSVCAIGSSQADELRAWGLDRDGQVTNVPAGSDYVAIAAGDAHGLALRADGTIVAWGQNDDGECEVPEGTYRAIGAGADFSLAVRTDGSLVAWGYGGQGQVSGVPAGNDFIAVDGGELFAVALKADGSIVAWGSNRWGQVSDAPAGTDFTAIAAGDDHAVALRSDGSVVSWGYWAAVAGAPISSDFTAVDAGGSFCVALRADGSLAWWGDDPYGYELDRVPADAGYIDVSAGYLHGLALRRDGTIVGWGAGLDNSGHPNWGQAMSPEGAGYTALACGLYFSVALMTAAEPVEPTALADNFDANDLGSLWRLSGEDLASSWLEVANQRLELLTSPKVQGVSAYCVASDWKIDPTGDFSFKVDYHYSAVTDDSGWIFLGIAPDANDLQSRYVKFGVGCDRQYPYLWYEAIDGDEKQIDFSDRRQDDGALYVSYDAAADVLHLSGEGYGRDVAWVVIPNMLGASWKAQPIVVFLGGGAYGLELKSGDAWLDNFVVDAATLSRPTLDPISEVFRFWSPVLERHFYTISAAERDKLIQEYSHVWTYEGPVYRAATSAFDPGLKPVYRFWSPTGQSHFYTIDEAEKDWLVREYSHVWTFEGVAFYAYPEGAQTAETLPVYRFWKARDNSHFYTMDEAERDRLIKEYSHVYTYEGVAFHAYGL